MPECGNPAMVNAITGMSPIGQLWSLLFINTLPCRLGWFKSYRARMQPGAVFVPGQADWDKALASLAPYEHIADRSRLP